MNKKQIKCPHCGSYKTNMVSISNNYCMDCDIEFNRKSGEVFTILYSGDLMPYFENEVANIN